LKQTTATVVSATVLPGSGYRSQGRTVSQISLLLLKCPEIAHEAKPGQFVTIKCGEAMLPRPFSVHWVQGDNIAILFGVWEGGLGTTWLAKRKSKEKIDILGPLGNGFTIRPEAKNLLLIAGGIGIAPLAFLAQKAIENDYRVMLLAGAHSSGQVYPENLLPPGIKTVVTTENGSAGKKGRVTDLIPEYINGADQIFSCGPMPMYKAMCRQSSTLLQSKPTQVSLEVAMGCGRGICYGCTVKTKQGLKEVCTDGPVFELNDVCWDELGL
jgi:dihydroorotate dehydrogenase electron transfer subunit